MRDLSINEMSLVSGGELKDPDDELRLPPVRVKGTRGGGGGAGASGFNATFPLFSNFDATNSFNFSLGVDFDPDAITLELIRELSDERTAAVIAVFEGRDENSNPDNTLSPEQLAEIQELQQAARDIACSMETGETILCKLGDMLFGE